MQNKGFKGVKFSFNGEEQTLDIEIRDQFLIFSRLSDKKRFPIFLPTSKIEQNTNDMSSNTINIVISKNKTVQIVLQSIAERFRFIKMCQEASQRESKSVMSSNLVLNVIDSNSDVSNQCTLNLVENNIKIQKIEENTVLFDNPIAETEISADITSDNTFFITNEKEISVKCKDLEELMLTMTKVYLKILNNGETAESKEIMTSKLPEELKAFVKVKKEVDPPVDFFQLDSLEINVQKGTENREEKSITEEDPTKEDLIPLIDNIPDYRLDTPASFEQIIDEDNNNCNFKDYIPKKHVLTKEEVSMRIKEALNEIDAKEEPVFTVMTSTEGLKSIKEKALSCIPSEFTEKISEKYDFQVTGFDSSVLESAKKPRCNYISLLQRTVQELRISGVTVHRDEKISQQLGLLIAAFILNGNIDQDLSGTLSEIVMYIPAFKRYAEEIKKHKSKYEQASMFAIYSLNSQLILPIIRFSRNSESLQVNHYDKSSIICDDDILYEMSNILEPLIIYHTFVLSPSIKLIDEHSQLLKPVFLYKKIEDLPRSKNNTELIIACLEDGCKGDFWNYINHVSKVRNHFEGLLELNEGIKKCKKDLKENQIRNLIQFGIQNKQIFNWACAFVAFANNEYFTPQSTLLDPFRANIFLKSIYISQE